ncbi:hypothetical protein L3C95_30285 [Chitinophaga filiformis]|uniref:hypothetical protein n=1 Tax=Chitinophaga filiformis TaxID=104663 RepID=UPI001F193454|nr:hypothetical protein [Chitinophaga filiformis]MCF6407222.1 hypothetical protein [Chitinophaga filiformis]
MKNISWLFVSIFTLSATITNAQYADDNVTVHDHLTSKDPFKTNGKSIDIDSSKLTKISLPDTVTEAVSGVDISGIEIVNAVSDSTILGYIQTGMFNKWKPAAADKPLTEFLQSFVNKQYTYLYKKDAGKLLWVIQEVRISERTFSMSERSFLHFKAISYTGDSNGRFRKVAALDTILVRGGMDVTRKHGNNIADALQLLLARSVPALQANDTAYTISEVKEKALARYNVPAFQAKEHTDGIYLTFQEFINDQPSFTNIAYDLDDKKVRFFYTDSTGKKTYVDKFWGVRKEGMLLKQHYNVFIPIDQNQTSIYLVNYLAMARRNNNAIAWRAVGAGLGGGLIGGAILGASGGATTTGGIPLVENVPYIGKKAPLATRVDIETGEFSL